MGSFLSMLSAPVSNLVTAVGGIIDKFVTSPEEKLAAQKAVLEIQTNFQLALVKADSDFAAQQASVVTAEVKSTSWMARNWRPILMLSFTYIIVHNYVLAPMFSLAYLPIPDQLWELLKIGMGGYIFGRSAEKMVETAAPHVAAAMQAKNQNAPTNTPSPAAAVMQ